MTISPGSKMAITRTDIHYKQIQHLQDKNESSTREHKYVRYLSSVFGMIRKVRIKRPSLGTVFALVIALGPLIAWFSVMPTIDVEYHSICDYRNKLVNRVSEEPLYYPNDDFPWLSGFATNEVYGPISLGGIFSSLYNINIAFGNYPFSVVKTIDVVWDIFVGRVGQVLMVYIASEVFRDVLLMLMEKDSVTYDMFTSISTNAASASALWMLCRDLMTILQRRKPWLGAMSLSLLWVLCFPTIMSAMTGYVALTDPYMELEYGGLMTLSNFSSRWKTQSVAQVIDGNRIGLQPNQIVHASGNQIMYNTLQNYTYYSYLCDKPEPEALFCPQAIALSIALSIPPLSPPSIPPLTINGITYNLTALQPPLQIRIPCQILEDTLYCEEDFMDIATSHVQCISKEDYSWGFSESILVMFVILHTIWCLGMYSMHHLAMWKSSSLGSCSKQEGRRRRKLGVFRASCDLAYVIEEQFGKSQARDSDDWELEKDLSTSRTRLKYQIIPEGDSNEGGVTMRLTGFPSKTESS